MRRNEIKYLILIVIAFILNPGCQGEKSKKEAAKLVGTWEIYDALRNGRSTATLKDGYMSFSEKNVMRTNILGSEVTSEYKKNGNDLSFDDQFPYSFKIRKLSADSLELSGRMRSFNMVFFLQKDMIEENDKSDTLISETHMDHHSSE